MHFTTRELITRYFSHVCFSLFFPLDCTSQISFFCLYYYIFSSVQSSPSVVSDSLRPHEPQHSRIPCPSPAPRVYSNSCPLSWWCHPTTSSLVIPFSSCLQSFRASESFHFFFLFVIFYFDIISTLQKNCNSSTKNSLIPFTKIPQILTFYHICIINLSQYIIHIFLNHLAMMSLACIMSLYYQRP